MSRPFVTVQAVSVAPPARADVVRPVFPSPTRGTARISFELPSAAEVDHTVFDALGRRVATLAESPHEAGHTW